MESDPTLAWKMDSELRDAIESGFEILELAFTPNYVQFVVRPRLFDLNRSLMAVKERLEPSGRIPILREKEGKLLLAIGLLPPEKKTRGPWLNIVLFFATIASTLYVGYVHSLGYLDFESFTFSWRVLGLAGLYSFSIMTILGLHELSHYIQSKRSGVRATFPYFLPVPIFPIGTFGAFIQIKSPILNRKSLLKIGFSGPFTSFALSVIAIIIGVLLSEFGEIPEEPGAFFLGSSILFTQLVIVIKGSLPPEGMTLFLHPVAFAGWVGLLITSINLIPIGQLDGGHISRSVFGDVWARRVSLASVVGLIVLGAVLGYEGWWFWAFLAFMLGGRGVFPLDDVTKVDAKHLALGIIAIIVFILSFIPVPFPIITP